MAWDYFRDEIRIGYARVLERITGGSQSKTTYLVRKGCCGQEATLTHLQLRELFQSGALRCKKCVSNRNPAPSDGAAKVMPEPESESRYFPGWGFALRGPMGFRGH